jgi:hypothetical protein
MRVCRSRQDLTFQYPCSPLIKGERAGSGGILHAQQLVNFARAIGISASHNSPLTSTD